MSGDAGERIAEVQRLIQRLVAGDPDARGFASNRGDLVDRAIYGLNALGAELATLRTLRDTTERRLNELLDSIVAIAAQDYSRQARVSGENDVFDGLAMGLNMMVEEIVTSTSLVKDILASMDDAVITVDVNGAITSANQAAYEMLGHAPGRLPRQPLSVVLRRSARQPRPAELLELFGAHDDDDDEALLIAADGRELPVSLSISAMRDARGEVVGAVCVARDISERRRAEEERERLQEALQIQAAAIVEMSTPLLPISDEIVIMPLVGAVDPGRAEQMLDTLLHGIQRFNVRVAILDITGVPVVDTRVAAALLRAVSAARLVGAEVVLTGIRGDVARTLVGLDVDLGGVATLGTLKSGVAYAQASLQRAGDAATRR